MAISHTINQGVIIVTLSRRLDTAGAEEFSTYCTGLPAGQVILDFSGLPYISSTGLRAVLQFGRERRQQGADVVLAGSTGFVLSVLKMSGFDQIFLMYPSTADALAAMGKTAN